MSREPCFCLGNGVVAQKFAVRYHDAGFAKLTEDVIHQLIDRVRYGDRGNVPLHLQKFLQGDLSTDLPGVSRLLVLQNTQTVIAAGDVLRHHLQFQTVIQRREDLLLRVVEIRDLIGCRKERDGGNGVCTALVGVLALIECRQQGVEDAVVTFEDLVEKANIRLRDLAAGVYHRLAAPCQGNGLLVSLQIITELLHLGNRRPIRRRGWQSAQHILQI